MADDKDTVMISNELGIILVKDECHEEVARFGVEGDLLSIYPGFAQEEIDGLTEQVEAHLLQLSMGEVVFYDMTPVGPLKAGM